MTAELMRRALTMGLLCACLSASGLFVACGGANSAGDAVPAGPAASAIDPCALVTSADASHALGTTVGAPERPSEANHPPALVTCRYVGPRGQGVAVMTIMVRQSDSPRAARAGFQSVKEQFQGVEAVEGVGEEAFFMGNQLNVLKGATHLNITGDFDQATATALARQAASRLP